MKIVLLASASSIHTIRWANGLSSAGVDVHLISQHPLTEKIDSQVKTYIFPNRGFIGYFLMASHVKDILLKVKPDILNAHYASGYGTTARIVNYRPWILSVWGSDVFNVPYKSPIHKWWINGNLKAASSIASTSHCMAEQIRSLQPNLKDIAITPFGVDMKIFSNNNKPRSDLNELIIGTIKSLKQVYGVDTLIRAFSIVKNTLNFSDQPSHIKLRLRIVGDGIERQQLESLAQTLKISESVDFIGHIPHHEVPTELRNFDIFAALSRSESFGVAAIEAGAMGIPVVVSDAGGLPEVVISDHTGLIVPKNNPEAAAAALLLLVKDADMRQNMGKAAQRHVGENYSWPFCVQKMISEYENTIRKHSNI